MMNRKQRVLVGGSLSLTLVSNGGFTQQPEYLTHEEPTPAAVTELEDTISDVVPPAVAEDRLPIIPEPEVTEPFWRDTSINLHLRSYYFERQRDRDRDSRTWALGGWLAYRSGLWRERIRLGATLHTSQRLYGPRDKPGSGLLQPVQRGLTVLGEAFVEASLTDRLKARLYRQTLDLPYVNQHDIRMLPNTFEAYLLADSEDPKFRYVAGHLTRMKRRDSDEFVPMSEAAGVPGSNKGVSTVGAHYAFTAHLDLGAVTHYSWDLFNTFYAEANSAWDLSDALAMRLSAQYTDQRSVGDERLGSFDTSVYGLRAQASYGGGILTLAYTSTGNGSGIRNPYGGYPGFASVIVEDFNRAGEDAWLIGLSYNFEQVGWDGLSAFVNYVSGDTPDSGRSASPDQEELDFTIDLKPPQGVLEGVWLRARAAFVDQHGDGARDLADYRIIINYSLPLL